MRVDSSLVTDQLAKCCDRMEMFMTLLPVLHPLCSSPLCCHQPTISATSSRYIPARYIPARYIPATISNYSYNYNQIYQSPAQDIFQHTGPLLQRTFLCSLLLFCKELNRKVILFAEEGKAKFQVFGESKNSNYSASSAL